MFITRKKYEEDLKESKEQVHREIARMNQEKILRERFERMERRIEELECRMRIAQEASRDNQ